MPTIQEIFLWEQVALRRTSKIKDYTRQMRVLKELDGSRVKYREGGRERCLVNLL